jgi:hypothetical protein
MGEQIAGLAYTAFIGIESMTFHEFRLEHDARAWRPQVRFDL